MLNDAVPFPRGESRFTIGILGKQKSRKQYTGPWYVMSKQIKILFVFVNIFIEVFLACFPFACSHNSPMGFNTWPTGAHPNLDQISAQPNQYTSTLTVYSVGDLDFTDYECRVQNEYGNTAVNITLGSRSWFDWLSVCLSVWLTDWLTDWHNCTARYN